MVYVNCHMIALHFLCHNPQHISGSSYNPFRSLQSLCHHISFFNWIWNYFLTIFSLVFFFWKPCPLGCSSSRWWCGYFLPTSSWCSSSLTLVLLLILFLGDGVTYFLLASSWCSFFVNFVLLLIFFSCDGILTFFPTSCSSSSVIYVLSFILITCA